MKLTDAEIIKAMECCKDGNSCPDECPFWSKDFKINCVDDDDGIMVQAYDLLVRQRDENERLRGVIKILEADVKAAKLDVYNEFALRLKCGVPQETGVIRCANGVIIMHCPDPEPSPCELCAYNPPSSGDDKPCTICPARAKYD